MSNTQNVFSSPRILLQTEYVKREKKNPRYSLRAFARSLGISHTVLSLVLNGKRPLSKKAARKIATFLAMDPSQERLLLENRKGSFDNLLSTTSETEYESITLETFYLMSEWQHYAILSLLEIPHARFESGWIARRLGLSEIEASVYMERLQRLGVIEKQKNGRWRQATKNIKIENKTSTAATRKFQRQLLELALQSLDSDPIETRDMSSITFAMDPKDVDWAKEKIREFRRKLSEDLEKKGRPKEVYNLTVQLYPVSRGEKE